MMETLLLLIAGTAALFLILGGIEWIVQQIVNDADWWE